MELFSENVFQIHTDASINVLQVENYEEVFFGVYEIEINKSKYPVEKISEHKGNPVVSVPVTVKGVKSYYPFVLSKGNFEVLFNENNTDDKLNEEPLLIDDEIISEKIEYPQEVDEDIQYTNILEKNTEIFEQIEKAKLNAKKEVQKFKIQKSKELQKESREKEQQLQQTLHDARYEMVEEFVKISQKIKRELVDVNDSRFSEIQITIDNKIQDLMVSLGESLVENFENASLQLESKIKELVSEIHKSIEPKIDKELKNIATEIVEKVDSIEKNLDDKLSNKADKILIENVEGELNAVSKANIELNDKVNRGVNKALSRVGNIDKKVDELTIALSEEVENKILSAEENITKFYTEKLKLLEDRTININDETRKYLIELFNNSRDSLVKEIREIKNEKPIQYIIESKGKKETKDYDSILKDFDKKIHDKFENYKVDLRKYVTVYASGGGTNAVQYQDGGTMNGNLTVVGSISASQYLGITPGGTSGNYLPLSGGTLTDNLTIQQIDGNSKLILGGSSETILQSIDDDTFNITHDTVKVLEIDSNKNVNITNGLSAKSLTVNTNTLVVNSVNGRVGIGTVNPAKELTIAGTDTGYQLFLTTQNTWSGGKSVGITFGDTTGATSLLVPYSSNALWSTYYGIAFRSGSFGGTKTVATLGAGNTSNVAIGGNINSTTLAGATLVALGTGNVGIGTTTPNEKLTVSGNLSATGTITSSNVSYDSGTDTTSVIGQLEAPSQELLGDDSVLTRGLWDERYDWERISMSGQRMATYNLLAAAPAVGDQASQIVLATGGGESVAGFATGSTNNAGFLPFRGGSDSTMPFDKRIRIKLLVHNFARMFGDATFWIWVGKNPTTQTTQLPITTGGYGMRMSVGTTEHDVTAILHDSSGFVYGNLAQDLDFTAYREVMLDIHNGTLDVYVDDVLVSSVSGGLTANDTANRFIAFYAHSFLSNGVTSNYARSRIANLKYKITDS